MLSLRDSCGYTSLSTTVALCDLNRRGNTYKKYHLDGICQNQLRSGIGCLADLDSRQQWGIIIEDVIVIQRLARLLSGV